MADFMKKDDAGKATQMETFSRVFPNYAVALGIALDDPMFVQQRKDAIYFRALLSVHAEIQSFAQAWTNWKKYQRDGGATAVTTPVLPELQEDFPEVVPPGIIPRYRACVRKVRACPACTPAILEALGVDKQEETAPDLETVQPDFKCKLVGGQPYIDWGWGGYTSFLTSIDIFVDRSDGKGEVMLTTDTNPGYMDTCPLPATPAKWTYRAIYRIGEARVGKWSNPVTIIVGG